ncbi:MAG: hypothetical protein AAF549_08125 [Pseudomonadota bacterium]
MIEVDFKTSKAKAEILDHITGETLALVTHNQIEILKTDGAEHSERVFQFEESQFLFALKDALKTILPEEFHETLDRQTPALRSA